MYQSSSKIKKYRITMIVAYKSGLALDQMKLSMVGICLLAIASLVLCVGATGKFICLTDLSIPSSHCASTSKSKKSSQNTFP